MAESIQKRGAILVVEETEFDLSVCQGKKVTVFKEQDSSLTIESKPVHQTTICELVVPAAVITAEETGEIDDMGTPVTREVIAPLDLSKTVIREFKGVA